MKVLRLARTVCQSLDPSFISLLNQLVIVRYISSTPLIFRSSRQPSDAFKVIRKWFPSKTYQHVYLKIIALCPKIKLVDEHHETVLGVFLGSVVNIYSSTTLEPHASSQDRQDSPVWEYYVSGMAEKFCLTDVPPHYLNLKRGVPVMVFRNVLHPTLMVCTMLFMEAHTRRMVYVSVMGSNGNETNAYASHFITFQFSYQGVKITCMKSPILLAFAVTVRKEQEQTLQELVVDLHSSFSPLDNCTCLALD